VVHSVAVKNLRKETLRMRYMMAADTGGTFTDIAVYDTQDRKVLYGKDLTNYTDLVQGALDSLAGTGASVHEASLFKHGTTHVINTLIERTGARTALVTTRGFRDVLEIGRGNRPVPFALHYRRKPPLIPRPLRHEVTERMDAQGQVLTPLATQELQVLAQQLRDDGVQAVAVSFLNAYANPAHEEDAVRHLSELLPGVYVTCGTALTREWFEYERTSTAAANAYVGARMASYLEGFDAKLAERGFGGTFYMMGSNGGTLSKARALAQPVALVESGPIGGCIGAAAYARALGWDRVIAFDMGGTTAKCALVEDGRFDTQPIYYVDGYDHGFPLRTPVLDIVEVGAGGGSIAHVDREGQLTVGPRSAGSEPGPVAFGRGGTEPTVTDANLVLGRIGGGNFMKGKLPLDARAAAAAIADKVATPLGYSGAEGIDAAAQGILDLAVSTMSSAIKEITIERGHDVRDFSLLVFGGSGPLFGSVLARHMGIPRVVIPPHPGNFSTVGMLLAGARIDLSQMVLRQANEDALPQVEAVFERLTREARESMSQDLGDTPVTVERALEMRFEGQKHTVRVACPPGASLQSLIQEFTGIYVKRYGHANAASPIELIEARITATAQLPQPALEDLAQNAVSGSDGPIGTRSVYYPAPHGRLDVPVWDRRQLAAGATLQGPAIIEEFSSTSVLMPGDRATVGRLGEITVHCHQPETTP
jgi:N-methylhydantoinase A